MADKDLRKVENYVRNKEYPEEILHNKDEQPIYGEYAKSFLLQMVTICIEKKTCCI